MVFLIEVFKIYCLTMTLKSLKCTRMISISYPDHVLEIFIRLNELCDYKSAKIAYENKSLKQIPYF